MQRKSTDDFNKFALNTNLFKGRYDLYYCYIKSEKIAIALAKIFSSSEHSEQSVLEKLLRLSRQTPRSVAELAAGALPQTAALVHVFDILTLLQLAMAEGLLSEDNATLLLNEYEEIVRRLSTGAAVGLITFDDLMVRGLPSEVTGSTAPSNKGHNKGQEGQTSTMRQNSRAEIILKIINENKRVSIKDISKIVRDCSEKTIQRELIALMQRGFVRKEGERRWSVYVPTPNP